MAGFAATDCLLFDRRVRNVCVDMDSSGSGAGSGTGSSDMIAGGVVVAAVDGRVDPSTIEALDLNNNPFVVKRHC